MSAEPTIAAPTPVAPAAATPPPEAAKPPEAAAEPPAPVDGAAPAETTTEEPDPDAVAAARVLRISREKKALREEKAKIKDDLALAGKHKTFSEKMGGGKGDVMAALEAAGYDPYDVYDRLTDQVLEKKRPQLDPAEAARVAAEKIVNDKLTEATKRQTEAVKTAWFGNAFSVLSPESHPGITGALARGQMSREDIFKVAELQHAAGEDSSPSAVLALIEEKAFGKPKPKAAPPPAAGAPAKSTPPPAAAAGTAAVKTIPDDDSKLTVEQVLAKAKAKHGIH